MKSNNISYSSRNCYAAVCERKFPVGIIMNNKDKDKIVNAEYSSEINFNQKANAFQKVVLNLTEVELTFNENIRFEKSIYRLSQMSLPI